MSSVNFNAAATSALRTLQQTNASLDATQNRISTGLKIGEAKDNAAYWSISTTMKSDNAAMSTVKDALGLGAATVDTAYQGLNAAKDVLDEIKSKLTAATQSGVDKAAIQQEIGQLQKQLQSIATSSTFSGENWLSVNSDLGNSDKSVVASFTRDSNNSVSLGTINVSLDGVALFDSGAAATGIVDGKQTLTDSNGVQLAIGGVSTGSAPLAASLTTVTGGQAGSNATSGTSAKATMGALNLTALHKDDRLQFDLTVDGGATRTVTVLTDGINDQTSFLNKVNAAINGTFGSQVATAAVDTAGNLTLTTASTGGASSTISVANVAAVNGNGVVSSDLGLTGSALTTYGTATAATASSGAAFVAPGAAWVAGDTLTIDFTYDGAVRQAVVDHTSGLTTTSTADDVAAAIQTAIAATAVGAGNVTVTFNTGTNKYDFATVAKGEAKSISVLGATAAGTNATAFGITNSGTTSMGTSVKAVYAAGTLDTTGMDKGDTLSFDLNVSGTSHAVSISTEGFTGNTTTDKALFVARVQNALNTAFGANTVNVKVDGGNAITFETVAKGDTQYIGLDNVVVTDGDGQTTGLLGLADRTTVTVGTGQVGTAGAPAGKASAIATTAYSGGAITLDADDSLTFTVNVNNAGAKKVVLTKAVIDGFTGRSDGSIADIGELASVVQSALGTAGIPISQVVVSEASPSSGLLKFEAATAGAGSIVVSDAVGFSGTNEVSVSTIDITTDSFKALSESDQRTVLTAYTKVVNEAITKVTAAAANLGAISSRIELQDSFVSTLMDTIEKGVSGLVDADMNEESTKLQALQVKQQLGVQALSIANQSAQSVLRLFQ